MAGGQHDWVTKRIDVARKAHPVNDGVMTAIKAQLQGVMRERTMRPAEMADLAKTLLDAIKKPADEKVSK